MAGVIINGIKYVETMNKNDLKKRSLEDNIYFTLRDIFWNCDDPRDCDLANHFNRILTNNVSYDEVNDIVNYTDVVRDSNSKFVNELYNYLNNFKKTRMYFSEDNISENLDQLIKLDDWWEQFEHLVVELEKVKTSKIN